MYEIGKAHSQLRHKIVDRSGHHVLGGRLANLKSPEVRFPARDLRAFRPAQIVREQAALGLRHEEQALMAILFD